MPSGALRVFDVHLMSTMTQADLAAQGNFRTKQIDREWMGKALDTFALLKEKDKLPYLWDKHNKKDAPANVIGRLDELRVDEYDGQVWLMGDVIITDPQHQDKFLAGKTPSKSAEFQPDSFYMRGLALLDGHEGHFDFGVPDFVPEGLYEELVALGADTEATVICHGPIVAGNGDTDMSEELLKQIAGKLDNVTARLEKLESKPAPEASSTGDIDEDVKLAKEAMRADYEAQLAKKDRESKEQFWASELSRKSGLKASIHLKKLQSFNSLEAAEVYFNAEMSKADAEVKLGAETEAGSNLSEEWAAYEKRNPNTTLSFDDYVKLSKDIEQPKDWSNKTVVAVKF